jgi:DtxR family Mn-dependent transcriptional regulator
LENKILSGETERLSASLEDYLEAMLFVILEKKGVRAKDIADRLSVSRPSVTSALQVLAAKRLINYAPYDVITLTDEGEKQAEKILSKHTVLQEFFTEVLLIEPEKAEAVACKIEHIADDALVERLRLFSRFMKENAESPEEWKKEFMRYCREHKMPKK